MRGSESRSLDLRAVWDLALPYQRFLAEATKNVGLWTDLYRIAHIPDWAIAQACDTGLGTRLLVIAEDWCGDASNTVPWLAKLADLAGCLELRVIKRDEHPEVMDRYLTGGSRSIPIVIALDADFEERGHWGPRPRELQEWVLAHRASIPSKERYAHARTWYAKDQGQTTLREVLELLK